MPSDLSEPQTDWQELCDVLARMQIRAKAAEAELATLKAAFTENQRERFARYAEEHAKVLGLEAERDALRMRLGEARRTIELMEADACCAEYACTNFMLYAQQPAEDKHRYVGESIRVHVRKSRERARLFLSDGAP